MYRRPWPGRGTWWAMVRCGVRDNASSDSGAAEVEPAQVEPAEAGPELARAVLDAALARRRAGSGKAQRRPNRPAADTIEEPSGTGESGRTEPRGGRGRQPAGRRLRGYSGPGPDPRDPQPIGSVLARLVKARGWQRPTAEATVFGAWTRVVGSDVAEHSRPVRLEEGVLTVEAESTAWATQLRLLAPKLLTRIAGQVGQGVVRRLHIHGPATPDWSKGPRRVRGRGPRDTYG